MCNQEQRALKMCDMAKKKKGLIRLTLGFFRSRAPPKGVQFHDTINKVRIAAYSNDHEPRHIHV